MTKRSGLVGVQDEISRTKLKYTMSELELFNLEENKASSSTQNKAEVVTGSPGGTDEKEDTQPVNLINNHLRPCAVQVAMDPAARATPDTDALSQTSSSDLAFTQFDKCCSIQDEDDAKESRVEEDEEYDGIVSPKSQLPRIKSSGSSGVGFWLDAHTPCRRHSNASLVEDNVMCRNRSAMHFFDTHCDPETEWMDGRELVLYLQQCGFRKDDPRCQNLHQALYNKKEGTYKHMNSEEFIDLIRPYHEILGRAFSGELVVPDFNTFRFRVRTVFEQVEQVRGGSVATYIPQLANQDPNLFAASVCTKDGQRFSLGDDSVDFCIQSCCKPLLYSIALEELGMEKVHQHVGREPSGVGFNSISLNAQGLPHNPMINSGAIMCSSLIRRDLPAYARFEYIMTQLSLMCGGTRPRFNASVYLSEKSTADANYALGYMMRRAGAFPEGSNLEEDLDLYFQCCSIEMTTSQLAIIAGLFANGGVCTLTGRQIISPETCRNVLSLMYSTGMYDYSGEFAFSVGIPAKSGVSGGIFAVIPHFAGFAIFSPPLDSKGNSYKGLKFFHALSKVFRFHSFDEETSTRSDEKPAQYHTDEEYDPRQRQGTLRRENCMAALYAAAEGDIFELRRLIALGVDVNLSDYDDRTCLHLAAAEGHLNIVKVLLRRKANPHAKDRWDGTPLSDAKRFNHTAIVAFLESYIAKEQQEEEERKAISTE